MTGRPAYLVDYVRTPFGRYGGALSGFHPDDLVAIPITALVERDVASEAAIERFGLTPIVRIVGAATAGVPPRIMGIGSVPATRKVLERHGWSIDECDVVELNEAFASQALASLRQLRLADDAIHVNPHGGSIALGPPTGASGARITGTAALEMRGRSLAGGLATMCVGVGQGISVLLERP